MSDIFIEFRNVSFSYNERPVLQDINLRIPYHAIVAIMGGSGSGKTTLLRLLSGELQPNQGEILVAGKSINRLSERDLFALRERIGMLFQFGALFTDLSAYDNIAFPLREKTNLPESAINDLVLMKLEAVGLRGAAQRKPHELSGGMARRIALARALVSDAEIILCDEPFTGLDPISLNITGKLIQGFSHTLKATTLLVTHDVKESLEIVDKVYFLSDGKIAAEGTPEKIKQSTVPFVKQFVHGQTDGPIPFHQPALPYAQDLGLINVDL